MSALFDCNGKRIDTMGVYDKNLLARLLPMLTFGMFGGERRHVTLFGPDNLPIPSSRIGGETVKFRRFQAMASHD